MDRSRDQYTARLCRLGIIVLASLWWVSAPPGALAASAVSAQPLAVAASACYDENNTCERSFGENCNNCPQDCSCICGDDICTETGPEYETCSSCPEDCWDQCVCGDSQCITPAEFGGYGSGNEPECNPSDPNAEYDYCELDCGGCWPADCDPYVCEDEYGQCRECDDDGECYWDDQYCAWYGQCEHSAICQSSFDCYLELGPGWGCGPSGVCVPEG